VKCNTGNVMASMLFEIGSESENDEMSGVSLDRLQLTQISNTECSKL